MLDITIINKAIAASNETKVVTLESFKTDCIVKKLTRKDTTEMTSLTEDIISGMIFVGVVDEDGKRVFSSIDQITSLHDKYVAELFNAVNGYNTENVEAQAKK